MPTDTLESEQSLLQVGILHETANELTIAIGYTEMVRNELNKILSNKDIPNKVRKELKKTLNLIDRVISYPLANAIDKLRSDLILSKDTYEKNAFLIEEVIATIIEAHNNHAKQHYIQIHIPEENTKHTVLADEAVTQTILSIFISNSIKYAKKRQGKIYLNTQEEDNYIRVSVADNGKGMTVKKLKKLQEGAWSETGNQKEGNNGIGFRVAQRMIEKMGGRVEIESKLNKGTTIHFTLPKFINKEK